MGKQDEQRDEIAGAIGDLFPAETARSIVKTEAFGALVYRTGQRMDLYGISAAEVLAEVDEDDREFAGQADNPAAFLARKVDDLPERAAQEVEAAGGNAPREVVEVIEAARTFIDAVERVGADEFGAAAATLAPAELAWTVDRLDDVRQSLGSALEFLGAPVKKHGADPGTWEETLADLSVAADGLYAAMQAIDPNADRHSIVGRL